MQKNEKYAYVIVILLGLALIVYMVTKFFYV